MSEVIIIKLKVDNCLAKTIKKIAVNYDIDKDTVDLTPDNINIVSSIDESTKLGHAIGDLIELLSIIKEKSDVLKN